MGMLLACLLAAVQPEVAVQTVNGERLSGVLTRLTPSQIAVQTNEGQKTWDLKRLAEIRFGPPFDNKVAPPISVELVDDSRLALESVTMEGGTTRVKLLRADSLEVPNATIRLVRFSPPGDSPAVAWEKILAAAATHDVLMIKKGDVVDYHAGILHRVTEDTVEFELDGERLPVRRGRVFGVVFHHPSGRELPASLGTLSDRTGSTWSVRSITVEGDAIEWSTPTGIAMRRSLADLVLLTIRQDTVVYLSDLKPDSVEWTPYFGLARELESRRAFFAPRFDKNLHGGPLQIQGQRYAKGLCIPSRTEMVFQLPERFTRFMAVVGIDDAARPLGHVRLVIRGDQRVLLDMAVAGTDPPRAVDVDLTGVRRLTVLVDFGDDFDVGDLLNLCEARLLK